MKRFALAIALACVLSGSALAGDIHSTGAPAPGQMDGPPTPITSEQSLNATAPGETPIGGLSVLLALLNLAF